MADDDIPAFDPTKPFDVVTPAAGASPPPFDPSKPFQPVVRKAAAPPAHVLTPQEQSDETDKDIVRSAGIGVVKGGIGLAGLPGDIGSGINWAAKKIGVPESVRSGVSSVVRHTPLGALSGPGSADIQKGIEGYTGEFYKPKTTAGEYAQTAGEFVPAALAGPGSLGRRLLTQVAAPALTSETAGQLTRGTAAEPYVRAATAVATPFAVGRAITPLPASIGRNAMNDALAVEGVTAQTAGQRTGNKALQYAESALGDYPLAGNLATNAQENAGRQFTEATLRRIGMNPGGARPGQPGYMAPTRPNVDQAVQNIQDTFTRLSNSTTLQMDRQFGQDLVNVENRYARKMAPAQRAEVQTWLDDFYGRMATPRGGGQMPGADYQIARSDLGRRAHAATDPGLADAYRGMRNALDGAMARSISPAERAEWQQARRHWANWRTIETPAKRTDANGNVMITPTELQNVASARDPMAYARGQGDYAGLAQAGQPILKTLPQSGTTPRAFMTAVTGGIGSAFTGGFNPVGFLAGAAVPGLTGKALMSHYPQQYLGNQLLRAGIPDSQAAAIMRALSAARGG